MDVLATISEIKDPALVAVLVYLVGQLRAVAKEISRVEARVENYARVVAGHSAALAEIKGKVGS